jgi:quinol monooxygenase YgiN
MYGTVAHVKAKPDRVDELLAILGEAQPDVDGFISSFAYRLDKDPTELVMVVVFKDKASYMANADDPETDRWYRRFRETVVADPDWNDGEIVAPVGI